MRKISTGYQRATRQDTRLAAIVQKDWRYLTKYESKLLSREWVLQDFRTIDAAGGVEYLRAVGQHAFRNRAEIKRSTTAWCFYDYWKGEFDANTCEYPVTDDTAFCPRCHIDAVIGDASGIPYSDKLGRAMWVYWFKFPTERPEH